MARRIKSGSKVSSVAGLQKQTDALEALQSETEKNAVVSGVSQSTLNNILEELKIITHLLKSIAE